MTATPTQEVRSATFGKVHWIELSPSQAHSAPISPLIVMRKAGTSVASVSRSAESAFAEPARLDFEHLLRLLCNATSKKLTGHVAVVQCLQNPCDATFCVSRLLCRATTVGNSSSSTSRRHLMEESGTITRCLDVPDPGKIARSKIIGYCIC